jgi:bacillaene synthase trans-acting acyltransferase
MNDHRLKIVFLFSGQGSQYRGMGQQLFEKNEVFRNSLMHSDSIVRKQLNRSLIDELYAQKDPVFKDLLITHPAIVAVEVAMHHVMKKMNICFDYVSGNSLGEFAAAVAAGIWDEKTAIQTCIEQAKSIVRHSEEGGMIAVLSERTNEIEQVYKDYDLYLAGENFKGHFTVAGISRNLGKFLSYLSKHSIPCFQLPVSFPFHSPVMDVAYTDFSYYMSGMRLLYKPHPGFISGIMGQDAAQLQADYFWHVARRPTNFIRFMKEMELKGPCLYIDLGPSGTSATFVKYNIPVSSASKVIEIITPYKTELKQLEKVRAMLGQ